MDCKNEMIAVMAMLILSIIYGIAGFTARELQKHFDIWQQLAIQTWLAWLILVCVIGIRHGTFPYRSITKHDLLALFGRALLGRILGSYCFIQACLNAPLGNVGWISALPTSAFFGWWLFGQSISSREWLLLLFSMGGLGIIVSPDLSTSILGGEGEIFALASVMASGLATLFGRQAVRRHGTMIASHWVLLFTALLATALAFLFEGGLKAPPTPALLILVLVSIMVVLGMACSLHGYTYLKASTATAILSLEAPWSVIFGILFFAELPSINSILGGLIIVAVAYLAAPQYRPQITKALQPVGPECR